MGHTYYLILWFVLWLLYVSGRCDRGGTMKNGA